MPEFQQFNFSGGINNDTEPYLLKDNESANLLNAKIQRGSLIPYTEKLSVSDPNIPELTNQNGERSLVKFGTAFYWSDNSDSSLSSTYGYMGITPPIDPLTVGLGPISDLFKGTRRYLIRFLTAEGFRSGPYLIGSTLPSTEFSAEQSETSFVAGEYPQFNARHIYFHNHSAGDFWHGYNKGSKVNYDGKSWRNRTEVHNNVPNQPMLRNKHYPGVHRAWENIDDLVVTESGSESFNIIGFKTATEAQVEFVELYRTIENGSNYYLATTFNINEGTVSDAVSDAEIQGNEQLIDFNEFPPVYVLEGDRWIRKGGKYLTEINEIFYLAVGDRLFMSKQSDPHSWNPAHNVRFDGDITAIAKIDDSIIVFIGEGVPWIVKGTVGDGDLSKLPIPTTQGCPNWKTIAYAKGTPIWQSDDGICGIARRPLGQGWTVEVLSKQRYEFDSIGNFALTFKDSYYLFFDNDVVVFDLGRDQFYRREIAADYGLYSKTNGLLYLIKDDGFFTLDDGAGQELTHLSAEYVFDDLNSLKEADFLQIDSDGDLNYSVWYDEVKIVDNRALVERDNQRCERLPSGTFYRLQIEIKCTAKVRGYHIHWKKVTL